MRINLSSLLSILLAGCMWSSSFTILHAADNLDSPTFQEKQLADVLEEISDKFQVFFTYDAALVKDILVDFSVSEAPSLDQTINSLLAPVGLSYEHLGGKYYVIYKEGKKGKKTTRKIKRKLRQIQKLEQTGNLSLQREQTTRNRLEKMSTIAKAAQELIREKTITGTVKDAEGIALIGATVLAKGTSTGTTTDAEGRFSLRIPDDATVLIVSYIGYTSLEEEINNRSEINIILAESAADLDEIIVVGFGTQTSSKVVSAVAQVSGEELGLTQRPVTSVQSALIGSVPGLRGLNANGRPGSAPNFAIRGSSTLSGTNILVIIDGFEGSLSDLDPQTVEKVSILKDASAVAVYGARGANGVMLITTTQTQRNQRMSTSYSFNQTVQSPNSLPQTPNSLAFMEYRNEASINEGGDPEFDQADLSRAASGFYPETSWPGELYNESAGQQSHNLSVSGGDGKTGYLLNANYLTQKGLVIGADNFNRLNLRLKVDTDITDWLSIGTNALITNIITNATPADGGNTLKGRPFFPVKTEDGFWVNKGGAGEANQIASAASGSNTKTVRDALNVQLYAQIKPFKGLVLEERVSFFRTNTNIRSFNNVYDFVTLDETDPDSYTNPDSPNRVYTFGIPDARSLTLNSQSNYTLRTLTTAKYELDNGNHFGSLLLGFQSEEGLNEGFQTGRTGFILDNLVDLRLGQIGNQAIGGGIGNTSFRGGNATTLSYFGRTNYDYKGRYLAEFSFRVDGSSNFLADNRFAFFPAVALGWNLAQENFLVNSRAVDQLKLRVSYGKAGDDSGVGRRVVQLVNLDVTGYPIGGAIQPSLSLGAPASQDLQWETSTTFNTGLDFSLWSGKIQGTFEYFNTQRDDILDEVITPVEFGLGNVPANLYSVKSWGWELDLTYKNKVGAFDYWVSGNITDYDNEITNLAGRENINLAVGQSVNDWLGYETDGFFDDQAELDAHSGVNQGNVGGSYIGGYKFIDQDGDGAITADDRTILKDNSDANLLVGFNLGASYKGFSLSARFYGALDRDQWWNGNDANEPFLNDTAPFSHLLNYWSPTNPNANFPLPLGVGINAWQPNISHLILDNEFIKLQNITLSYNFDQTILDKLKFIRGLSIIISVENIATLWTNSPAFDTGWDPELGVGSVDYPLPRSANFGVNVKF